MSENQGVRIERVFDAPVELVWKMWTDPEMMKKWWGPNHYSAPTVEIDLRVGGKSVLAMQGPDGNIMYSGGVYKEIIPLKKIVTSDSFTDKDGNPISPAEVGMPDFPQEMEVTLTFEEKEGKTYMLLVHKPVDGTISENMIKSMNEGWSQSFDKLVEELKK